MSPIPLGFKKKEINKAKKKHKKNIPSVRLVLNLNIKRCKIVTLYI